MQTVYTLIKRRALRRLVWVYTVCQCLFYGTPNINGLKENPETGWNTVSAHRSHVDNLKGYHRSNSTLSKVMISVL